jgi:hypothetical protein
VGVKNDGRGVASGSPSRRTTAACGQLLGEGRRSEGGGPVARGGGEGGDYGCGIRDEKTNGVGVKNPTDGGDSTLLKGAAGTQRRGGGSGEVGRRVEGLEEGGP